jgi:two-component system sensor histidine kinase MtrB
MATGDHDTRIRVTGHDELADLGGAFDAMAATLQADAATLRSMEAKARRFAADISHELRTPLAAMTAVTGLLDDDAASGHLGPETSEAITLVADETRKLAHPRGTLPHVFDRFTKGDTARTRSEGSGLGPAIAAENARLHGGTLAHALGVTAPPVGAVVARTCPPL